VSDVFRPDGELKKTFIIPAKYTKTNKSREAYIVVPQQRHGIEKWRELRLSEAAIISDDGSFNGLRGDSPLFLSKKGIWRKFAFNVKRYKTPAGRRTLATWLDLNGLDLELIRYILNHEAPKMTIEYIDP
jgi:hypothetical protein